ncbi:MAG: molybdopterin molybdotransferase MoeA [Syntrophobacteraceae bacterium]
MELKHAKEIAAGLAKRLETEMVGTGFATGRVMAENMRAERDIPEKPTSKWDGFALRSFDCEHAGAVSPVILPIVSQEITAGKIAQKAQSLTCARIMTGGVLPEGMDAVIAFEKARICREGLVLTAPLRPGSGVTQPGSKVTRNTVLLGRTDVLTPGRIALAAAQGWQQLCVVRRPRVAILATGDELRGSGAGEQGVSIFSQNTTLLAALVRISGAEPVELGVAPDDPQVIYSRLKKAQADLVITTGGMGKGSKDFTGEVWKRLGLKVIFDRLNIGPGKDSALATGNGSLYLGLPGNPGAVRIIYEEIATVLVRSFLGLNSGLDFAFQAITEGAMQKIEGYYRPFEGVLKIRQGICAFIPQGCPEAGQEDMASFFRSPSAYALLPPGNSHVDRGQGVLVKIPDLSLESRAMLPWGE